jgi:hypothetical protein
MTSFGADWLLDPPTHPLDAYGNAAYAPLNPTHPSWQKLTRWQDLGRNGEYLRSVQTKWVYIHPSNNYLWRLAGPGRGREGVVLAKELEGAMHPPFDIKYSEGPYLIGAQAERVDYQKRTISLGVVIQPNRNAERREDANPFSYRLIEDKWWSSWSNEVPGYLGSFTRTHGWRWLKVLLGEASKTAVSIDPVAHDNNLMQWNMVLHAPWPFYSKRSLTKTFKCSLDNYRVDTELCEGTIKVPNRGTWESWPKYLITGHGDVTIQDGTGGRMITLPRFYSSDGDYMMVDTDPTKRTIVTEKDPVDDALFKFLRNSQLLNVLLNDVTSSRLPAQRRIPGGVGFDGKIPRRTVANIKVTHSNINGSVTCIMPQNYEMAWS